MKLYIVDLDGTFAVNTSLKEIGPAKYYTPEHIRTLPVQRDLLEFLTEEERENTIVFVSLRARDLRKETIEWLKICTMGWNAQWKTNYVGNKWVYIDRGEGTTSNEAPSLADLRRYDQVISALDTVASQRPTDIILLDDKAHELSVKALVDLIGNRSIQNSVHPFPFKGNVKIATWEEFKEDYEKHITPVEATYQPPPIKGYRPLSQTELDAINEVKEVAEKCGELVEKLEKLESVDKRWLAIGKTDLQKGFMFVARSIAKPTSF